MLGRPVDVPADGEYVALGAARQAAWVLVGGEEPPSWPLADVATFEAPHDPAVMAAYWKAAPELAS